MQQKMRTKWPDESIVYPFHVPKIDPLFMLKIKYSCQSVTN